MMLMATCQPFVHGLTKSGTGTSIAGQALSTSLTHPTMIANSVIKVSIINAHQNYFFL
jgi:hypothetical protein